MTLYLLHAPDPTPMELARRAHAQAVQDLVVQIAASIAADVTSIYPSASVIDIRRTTSGPGQGSLRLDAVCALAGTHTGCPGTARFTRLASQIEPDLDWIDRITLVPGEWNPTRLDLARSHAWYRCTAEPTSSLFPDLGAT